MPGQPWYWAGTYDGPPALVFVWHKGTTWILGLAIPPAPTFVVRVYDAEDPHWGWEEFPSLSSDWREICDIATEYAKRVRS